MKKTQKNVKIQVVFKPEIETSNQSIIKCRVIGSISRKSQKKGGFASYMTIIKQPM